MSRSVLLPPYLDTDVWNQLIEAIDEVFGDLEIDDAKRQLQLMRQPINTADKIYAANLQDGRLTDLQDVESLERDSVVQQAKVLGFNFSTSSLFKAEDYLRLTQYISAYYTETKGTEVWQNFLGFCVNANFQVHVLWTRDYVTFYEEGDPAIGFAVYEGGEWYPTTHVVLEYDSSKFGTLDPKAVTDFFYYFANINLVLEYISLGITGTLQLQVAINGYLTIEV